MSCCAFKVQEILRGSSERFLTQLVLLSLGLLLF